MSDLRMGVSEMAQRALDELDMLAPETRPAKEVGRAMAEIDVALITQSPAIAASRCTIAAARLIRAAELFEQAQQQNAPGLEQAAEGAGSEVANPSATPSPSAANTPEQGVAA